MGPVDLWIPSTAQLMLRTLGPPIRRSGAAESTTAAALSPSSCQLRSLSHHQPILTIAPLDSQIGWRVGPLQRRLGAAVMKARAAHQQLVGVLRSRAENPQLRFCYYVISRV